MNTKPRKGMTCDNCGGKCPHPYGRLNGKQYCSRNCYDIGKKTEDGHHHEDGARVIGVYDEGEDYEK